MCIPSAYVPGTVFRVSGSILARPCGSEVSEGEETGACPDMRPIPRMTLAGFLKKAIVKPVLQLTNHPGISASPVFIP